MSKISDILRGERKCLKSRLATAKAELSYYRLRVSEYEQAIAEAEAAMSDTVKAILAIEGPDAAVDFPEPQAP